MNDLCPVCNEKGRALVKDGRDFFILDGKSEPFEVYYCEGCQLGYSIPYISDAELSSYYPDDYEAYKPKKFLSGYLQTLKYKSDLKRILRRITNIEKEHLMLEIGAGRGEFLAEAKKIGFAVEGIEPSEAGRRYARENFGIDLSGEFASEIVFKKKYDVIVMRYVFEHVNQPVPVLEGIFNAGLKPGGLFFMKLPRLDSWEARLFGRYCDLIDLPRHRVHFTKPGVIKLLERFGFKDIKIRSEVVPTSIIRSLQFYSSHAESGFYKTLSKAFIRMPYVFQLLISQIVGFVLLPFGAGRMIIEAKR